MWGGHLSFETGADVLREGEHVVYISRGSC